MRPTRTLSSHQGRSTPFTSVLDMCSFRASSSIGVSISTYSRSHETGTLISTRTGPHQSRASRETRSRLVLFAPHGCGGGGPGGRGPRTRSGARSDARRSPLELLQVPNVVLVEETNVRRPGAKHREALDAAAEGEALVARGVIADAAQHVRVDHPAAGGLDPTVASADAALGVAPFAGEAAESDLRGRLGEREVIGPEADLPVASEDLPRERIEHALQVDHRELLVDGQALVLKEDALPDRVRRLVSVAPPWNHHADRRPPLLHDADLHRRRVGAPEDRARRIVAKRVRDPKRLPLLARGMPRRNVERLEVVVIPLDLGPFDCLEPERREDARDLPHRLGDRVEPSDAHATRRERHVLALAAQLARQPRLPPGGAPIVERTLDALLRLVHRRAVSRLLARGELRDAFRGLAERALFSAEILYARPLERGFARPPPPPVSLVSPRVAVLLSFFALLR